MKSQKASILAAFILISAVGLSPARAAQDATLKGSPSLRSGEPITIHWLVAHDRGHSPFVALNERWAKALEKKSGGRLKVEFTKSDAPESQLDETTAKAVASGKYQMSQLAASGVGVHVFDMPFVFRSYEHAEAVFNGAVGKALVASIDSDSQGKLHGFGFTYSGGYRVFAGKPVRRLADFKGLRVRRDSARLGAFLEELGAEPQEAGPASRENPIRGVAAGQLDIEETEVNRLALVVTEEDPALAKKLGSVSLTYHRMYVTALVANADFLASLPKDLRDLLGKEVGDLAVQERKLSIDLQAKNLKVLASKGIKLVDFAAEDKAAFEKAGVAFRNEDAEMAGLVGKIQAVDAPAGQPGK